jgi:membrane-associated protease RseP (regulator of RpoE activity)
MLGAQTAWDATMAFHAAKTWREAKDDRAIVVVLVGSGHVAYGLGIERQARGSFDGQVSSIIPLDIVKGETMTVRASYADIVWGVPREPYPAYPSLGITPVTRSADHLQQVVVVDRNSAASQAGVMVGDIVVAIDGEAVTSRESFNRLSAVKDWGDVAEVKVRRGGDELTLKLLLRR